MKKAFMLILACPMCKFYPLKLADSTQEGEEIITGLITCPQCKRTYPINDEIPELMPDELKGWYAAKGRPQDYDEHFDQWLPKTQMQAKSPWPFKIVIAKKAKGFVLDAGCGPGILNRYLENAVFLDFSSVVLKKRWVGRKRPRVMADAENMPFKNGVFNTVIATELIEHTDNPRKLVEETHRILKNNGQFLFSFPWSDVSPTHKWKNITEGMINKWIDPPFKKYEFAVPPVRKERGMVYAHKGG